MGETLEAIRKLGLLENTVIIFTSDHGEFTGDHGLPGKAPFLLDCMVHQPLIARVPGAAGGNVSEELTESVDLFPTICELTGLEIPRWVQGRSLAPLITGEKRDAYRSRDAVCADTIDSYMCRTKDWKLIHNLHPEFAHTNHSDLDRKPLAGAYWTEWAELAKTDGRARKIVDRYFRRPEWELYHVAQTSHRSS